MANTNKSRQSTSTKEWGAQAERMLVSRYLDLSSRHAAKQSAGVRGNRSTGKIHSFATLAKNVQVLKNAGEWIGPSFGVTRLDKITAEQAQAYLDHRAAHGIGQKQLDADRVGLKKLTNVDQLQRVKAAEPQKLQSRAYTPEQVHLIVRHQTERNALPTELSYRTGVRAHELLTLRRADEGARSSHREWRDDLFRGRTGDVYLVTGKGGLTREIMVPHDLAERLEAKRWDAPITVFDRNIRYECRYDIGGGNAWSQSFSNAARAQLGWTAGAHGLRHSYAQERVNELQRLGHIYDTAKQIVSQEVGHFRPDVVNTYLR